MKKLKSPGHVLIILIVVFFSGLGFSRNWALFAGKNFSGGFQELNFKILIIDCKSSIFSELYDLVLVIEILCDSQKESSQSERN